MKIRENLFQLLSRKPGLTATGYAKEMNHASSYAPASVIRELGRMREDSLVWREKTDGMRKGVKAYRWYLI